MLRIYVIAGEPSGDVIGARLLRALRKRHDNIEFYGIGGKWMKREGLHPRVCEMSELSVMGLFEVFPHLFNLNRRIKETVKDINEVRPHGLVTIDSKGFNFRVLQSLGKGITRIHYVGPSVWAYRHRNSRSRGLGNFMDELFLVLPFERDMHPGTRTTFVGYPAVESLLDWRGRGFAKGFDNVAGIQDVVGGMEHLFPSSEERAMARNLLGIRSCEKLIGLFPGSRFGEVWRSVPILKEVISRRQVANLDQETYVLVVPDVVYDFVAKEMQEIANVRIFNDLEWKTPVMVGAHASIAVSGTVVTELACFNTPCVVIYRANMATEFLAKSLAAVRFVSIPNIMADKMLIPELLFSECQADKVNAALERVLDSGTRNEELASVTSKLFHWARTENSHLEPVRPSEVAAQHVLNRIQRT